MSYTPQVNADTLQLYLGICATGRARAGNTTLDNVSFGTVYNPRPSITFTPDDVGMPIAIVGGGPVDALMPPVYFVQGALFHTTIAAYVSPTEVTLAAAPDTSIWNTGFATVILYRPCPFASDVAGVPTQFKYDSSIAPGTADTLQFSVLNSLGGALGQSNPYIDRFGPVLLGQPVYLHSTDSSVGDIFGGYIDTLTTSSQPGVSGKPYCWSATCVSWTGLAKRRVVPPAIPTTFTGVAGDVVFRTLVLDYLSDDGVSVSTSAAPDISLSAAIGANVGQLLDQVVSLISTADTAWYWTSDPWRTFVLTTRTATPAPWNVSNGDDLLAGQTPYLQSLVQTHNQLANNVYIIGSATLLNTLIADLVGNGTATTFNLPEPVGSAPTVTLNSLPQTVGVLSVDSGKDWYWAQSSAVLTQATGATVLQPTDELQVTYTPEVSAVAQAPNTGSLQSLQAIEGTSANYDYSATLSQPILPDDLLAFATAYELEYGEPATTCQFYTLRPGLAAGQLQTIDLPEAGIPSGSYLIATISMSTMNNVIAWQYTAFGGANIGNAITQLTQFINRSQATLSLTAATTAITGAGTTTPSGYVAGVCGNGVGVNPPPIALPGSVAAGDLIFVAHNSTSDAPTDSEGNTYTMAISRSYTGPFSPIVSIWYTFASAAAYPGSLTITMNPPRHIIAGTISGVNTAAPVDSTASNLDTAPSITVGSSGNTVVTAFASGTTSVTVPTVTAPEVLAGYTDIEIEAAAVAKPGVGSFSSSLALSGGVSMVYASVSFAATPGTTPPSQTTTVQANPQGTVTHSVGALTSGLPVIGHGGGDITVGTKTGVTSEFASVAAVGSVGEPVLWGSTGDQGAGVVGQLVPPGGSTSQVLTKTSNADYAVSWQVSTDDIQVNGTTSLNIIQVNGTQVWIGQTEIQIEGTFI